MLFLHVINYRVWHSFWMYKADIINVSWIIESYISLCSIFICNNIQALHILDMLPHFQTNSFQSIWWEKFGFSCCILITNQSNWSRWSCCFIPKHNNIYMYTKIFQKKKSMLLQFWAVHSPAKQLDNFCIREIIIYRCICTCIKQKLSIYQLVLNVHEYHQWPWLL